MHPLHPTLKSGIAATCSALNVLNAMVGGVEKDRAFGATQKAFIRTKKKALYLVDERLEKLSLKQEKTALEEEELRKLKKYREEIQNSHLFDPLNTAENIQSAFKQYCKNEKGEMRFFRFLAPGQEEL